MCSNTPVSDAAQGIIDALVVLKAKVNVEVNLLDGSEYLKYKTRSQ